MAASLGSLGLGEGFDGLGLVVAMGKFKQEANGQEQLVGKGGMCKITCSKPCLVCFG